MNLIGHCISALRHRRLSLCALKKPVHPPAICHPNVMIGMLQSARHWRHAIMVGLVCITVSYNGYTDIPWLFTNVHVNIAWQVQL